MNLLDIRTEAKRIMAELSTSASYCTTTDLNKFINLGIKELCTKANAYEKPKSLTVTNGLGTYELAIDFISVRSLRNHDGMTLHEINVKDLGRMWIQSGYPLYYYLTQTAKAYPTRANDTVYSGLGWILRPATPNGYMYEVTTTGTSGPAIPTYPTDPGATVTDGTVVLTCRELATTIWTVNLIDTPTTTGAGVGTYPLLYNALDEGLYTDTDCPNFPNELHHNLSIFAAAWGFVKAKDYSKARDLMVQFATSVGLDPSVLLAGTQIPRA